MTGLARFDGLSFSLSLSNVRTWLLIVTTIVLLGVVYMGQASQAAVTGQRVLDKQDKLVRLNQENVQLQADIAVLLAPERIEKRARALGLHLATTDQIKYVVVKDYPTGIARPAAQPTATTSAVPNSGWSDLLARLGLSASPRSAEATTSP